MLHRNFLMDNQKAYYTALTLSESCGVRPNHVCGVSQNWGESSHKSSRYFNHLMTGESCAGTGQSTTFQGMFYYQSTTLEPMSFHYRFSRGDRVQIISGKYKGETGIVDANVFQRSVDFPNEHLPCHHVLLDNRLVITINVNQVEALNEIGPVSQ